MSGLAKTVNEQFNEVFSKHVSCCQQLIDKEIMDAYEDIAHPLIFVKGMQDARDGVKHEAGQPIDYDRGYAAQKELEAINEFRYAPV